MKIDVSERAAQRILEVQRENPGAYVGLRVGLRDGGCSGYAYDLAFEAEQDDDDVIFERDGAKVLVHPLHLPFLAGSMLQWSEGDMVSGFTLENPNVQRVCGCGESFDVAAAES